MARFTVLPPSPLPVQFWLLGLDARSGLLAQRGFERTRPSGLPGSSLYTLGGLTLHSSGLWLETPQGQLAYQRRPHRFLLGGLPYPTAEGVQRIRPHLLEHEAWVVQTLGQDWREQQLAAYRLPPPIRCSVPHWHRWLEGEHGLSALLWQVPGGQGAPCFTPAAPGRGASAHRSEPLAQT
ncbi:hypothetical protein GCM10017783_15780 [Deinococcus piscis]|uniref:Uncharacterized protein n=1 Tax=Deinococcus piscis TaxID=394230 RepID=A0ABQ3K9V8_9DEIO|nr:hypothetical protein [Deinococcus piscis]GHG04031.1 hypothetical protein GCM10017783_15780 [Deinococcus piscis]